MSHPNPPQPTQTPLSDLNPGTSKFSQSFQQYYSLKKKFAMDEIEKIDEQVISRIGFALKKVLSHPKYQVSPQKSKKAICFHF